VLSGFKLDDDALAARRVAGFLRKPFGFDALLGTITGHLDLPPLDAARAARVEDHFAAIADGDWERLVAGCTDDVVYHFPGDDERFGRHLRGRAAFAEHARESYASFPEMRFDLRSVRPLPRGVLVDYVGHWRDGAGQPAEIDAAVIFGLAGDLIAEIGVRLDLSRLRALTS
jgi:ketosteroid isomerase-like protein